MRFAMKQCAAPGERFLPGCFDSVIGQTIPVNYRQSEDGLVARRLGEGTLVAARISQDGSSAELTFEIDDDSSDTAVSVIRDIAERDAPWEMSLSVPSPEERLRCALNIYPEPPARPAL